MIGGSTLKNRDCARAQLYYLTLINHNENKTDCDARSKFIGWESENNLKNNVKASRKTYDSIDRDFDTCLEYIALDSNHFSVYSPKIADIILKIGPEILTVFNLILFNKRITRFFNEQPELKRQIVEIQKRKSENKDGFMYYLRALPDLVKKRVIVEGLEQRIKPFEIKKTWLTKKEKYFYYVEWWRYGYNALKHRKMREFKEAAIFKYALFSLAGLWVLHDRLDSDWGRKDLFKSRVFRRERVCQILSNRN